MNRRCILGALIVAGALAILWNTMAFAGDDKAKKGDESKEAKKNDAKDRIAINIDGQLADSDPPDAVQKKPSKSHIVELKKDKRYIIDMKSTEFDAYLRLEDSAGKILQEDDDAGGDTNSRIAFIATKDDKYKLIATTFDGRTGKYQLAVREVVSFSDKVQTVAKEGLKIESSLEKTDDFEPLVRKPARTYRVRLEADKTYIIDMMSAAMDPFLFLEDSAGNKLALDDDGGDNNNARIVYRVANAGVYNIVCTAYDERVGAFTLQVKEQ